MKPHERKLLSPSEERRLEVIYARAERLPIEALRTLTFAQGIIILSNDVNEYVNSLDEFRSLDAVERWLDVFEEERLSGV